MSTSVKGDVACPTCGRDDFSRRSDMKTHHKLTHGSSIAGVTVECDNCGAEDRHSPSQVRRSDNHFCSRPCRAEYFSGERHYNWDGGPVEIECVVCGATESRGKWRIRRGNQPVCSPACRGALLAETLSGENHYRWKEDRPGDKYVYPFNQNRELALERDGYECRSCGMGQEQHREIHGAGLHVHHVTPVSEYDHRREAHAVDNLVTACAVCHRRFEGLPVFPN